MNAKIITSLFLICALFFSFSVSAKDVYANATTGLDTNNGLTQGTSVQTVAQAYALAADGDVIKLIGTFLFDNEITLSKSITIESATNVKAILDGQSITRFFTLQSNVTCNNLKFQNGYAGDGGAFFMPIGWWRSMNFNDCIFDGNNASGQGGVIRMVTYGGTDLLKINRCLFTNNRSGNHGGVISYIPEGGDPIGNSATLSISNSTFTNNKNNGGVGGILMVDGGAQNYAVFNFNHLTVSGNSDQGNVNGNLAGLVFIGSNMKVNVSNSIFEGNASANGDYADFSFGSATPTALNIKNSIIGHLTNYGATINPTTLASSNVMVASNINNMKFSADVEVAGLGTFNGTYFPLISGSLAYNFGRMSNVTTEIAADQLGVARINSDYTSAGAVEFYHDKTSQVVNSTMNSNVLVGKNQITISAENSKVDVFNISGVLVNSALVAGTTIMHLQQGIYLVKISSPTEKITSKVIIK